jgi:hypothetical protein
MDYTKNDEIDEFRCGFQRNSRLRSPEHTDGPLRPTRRDQNHSSLTIPHSKLEDLSEIFSVHRR